MKAAYFEEHGHADVLKYGDLTDPSAGHGEVVIGVAGDTKSTSVSGLPTTNASSMGAFVNRVSDTFDETKASGRMTVYQNGGVFATNEYEATGIVVNSPLYVSTNGKLTITPSLSAQIVAYCTVAPGPYESGVPGTDINGSMSLGNYLEFKMVI